MSSRLTSGFVIFGGFLIFLGICCMPAALGNQKDTSMMMAGISLFSTGALIMALGMYFKARMIKAGLVTEPAEPETAKRPVKGGCDLCGTEVPVVLCRVHQVHVCGTCLNQHFDPRSCAYIPTTRTVNQTKGIRSAARAGA